MQRFSMLFLLLAACAGNDTVVEKQPAAPAKEATKHIVGGINDTRRDYVVGVGGGFGGASCSGTVISKRVVVTAGHCFGGITTVYTGPTLNGPKLRVKRELRHPDFKNDTLAHDLALLELEEDAPMQAAPLLRENMNDDVQSFVGPKLTFAGYGYSSGTTYSGFGTRRVATFAINAVGPAQLPEGDTVQAIDETMFYYQLAGKNTCNGDSGGPAFVSRNGVERHAGVTSFGDTRCVKDGVQQRTDKPVIDAWIQRFIDEVEGDNPCRANGGCDASCQSGDQLVDPDCAEAHCAADGVCALACAHPADPDCGSTSCGADGLCDAACSDDVDC